MMIAGFWMMLGGMLSALSVNTPMVIIRHAASLSCSTLNSKHFVNNMTPFTSML